MKKTISRPHERWGKIQREALKYLKGNNLRVYADLLTYADSKGRCYPSVETIANDLDMHPRNVQKALANLEGEGWIEKHLRTNTSTIYQIYFVKVHDETKQTIKKKPAKKSNSSDGVAKSTGSEVVKRTAPRVAKNAVSGVAESTTLTDHLIDHNNRPKEEPEVVVVSDIDAEYKLTGEEKLKFKKLFKAHGKRGESKSSALSAFTFYASKSDPKLMQYIETGLSHTSTTFMTNQMKMLVDEYYEEIEARRDAIESKKKADEWNRLHPEQTM